MVAALTQKRLKEVLTYDPSSGVFVWIAPTNQRIRPGSIAGAKHNKGYRAIRIDGDLYLSHRLAWLWMCGEFPSEFIDHANCDRADNRWVNLRLANPSQNGANMRARKSALKGTWLHRASGKWCAAITVSGRYTHLGLFASREDAHAAYAAAAQEHFGEFARTA